jgi:hypothetical protein
VILGAHGPKALERVVRSYDGWMPLVPGPAELQREVTSLRKLLRERGRDERSVQITPLVDPLENGPSTGELKVYRESRRRPAYFTFAEDRRGHCRRQGTRINQAL